MIQKAATTATEVHRTFRTLSNDASFLRMVASVIEDGQKAPPDARLREVAGLLFLAQDPGKCARWWQVVHEDFLDKKDPDYWIAQRFEKGIVGNPTVPEVMRYLADRGLPTRRSQVQRYFEYLEVNPSRGRPGRKKQMNK